MGMRLTLCNTSVFISAVAQVIGSVHYSLRHARPPADGAADCFIHRGLTYPYSVHSAPMGFLYRTFRLLTICDCRFLSHTIHTQILNPAFLPVALRTLRATLFPNNALGPPREIPTDEEARAIKHRCAATLLDLIPSKVAAGFFANSEREAQIRQIEDTLSCLDDAYLNKHFVFQVVELIVLRLFPELGEQGVKDLLEDRIS